MQPSPGAPIRRSQRLAGRDYTRPGSYFVTLCTVRRQCLFGEITAGQMRLNEWGTVAEECWRAIPEHFGSTALGAFVVMPNHLHGILRIVGRNEVGATYASPVPGPSFHAPTAVPAVPHQSQPTPATDTDERATHASPLPSPGPRPGSVGAIVGAYKSAVSRLINTCRGLPGTLIWQRDYYEHLIRNGTEWTRIQDYIVSNPSHWAEDRENPDP